MGSLSRANPAAFNPGPEDRQDKRIPVGVVVSGPGGDGLRLPAADRRGADSANGYRRVVPDTRIAL